MERMHHEVAFVPKTPYLKSFVREDRMRSFVAVVVCGTLVGTGCTSTPTADPTPPPASSGSDEAVRDDEGRVAGAQSTSSPQPVPSTRLPTGSWTTLSDAPLPLTEVAAAPLAGQVWVAGGFQVDGSATDTVQVYEPAFDAWSPGPALPEAVHHAALVSDGTRLLLIGGYAASGGFAPSAAVRVLDPATGLWEDGPQLPAPRAAGGAAWDGERVVYAGGVDPSGVRGEVFALVDGAWSQVGALGVAREHLAVASDGQGSTWVLGGRTAGLDSNRSEVDLVVGGQVRSLPDLPTARGGVAGFYAPGFGACAAGGEGPDGTFGEVECSSPEGDVVTLPSLAEPRHGIGAVVLEGLAYVLLGGPEPGLTVSPTAQALSLRPG